MSERVSVKYIVHEEVSIKPGFLLQCIISPTLPNRISSTVRDFFGDQKVFQNVLETILI